MLGPLSLIALAFATRLTFSKGEGYWAMGAIKCHLI